MTSRKKNGDRAFRCACGPGDIWTMTEGAKKDEKVSTVESSGQAPERTPDDGEVEPAPDSEG